MKRRFIVPETLQTSGMDCGPAALKSLLAGLSIPVNYERLRAACSTSADGTSIDVMEDLCLQLGLDAFQEITPLADAVDVLQRRAPAIVVVNGPGGSPHFVVFWRAAFGFVQVMDPGRGRRWVSKKEFVRELFVHEQPFDDELFRKWFPSTAWKTVLEERLRRLGVEAPLASLGGDELTATDSAARLLERVAAPGKVAAANRQAVFLKLMRAELAAPVGLLPKWLSARGRDPEGRFVCRGAAFLAVHRPSTPAPGGPPPAAGASDIRRVLGPDGPGFFDVFAAQLTGNGRRLVTLLAITAALLTVLAGAEMIFLRAAFNAESLLSLPQQRFAGTALYGGLVALMLALEVVVSSGIVRLGRTLELRTRIALLQKLPRLPDHYFRTRPMSDVAHRSRGLAEVKPLPELFATIGKQSLDLVLTVVALCVLHPRGIPLTLLALVFGLFAPYIGLGIRKQVESRVQAHASALGQLYLDALLGLVPLKTHGAKPAIRAMQEGYLVDWRKESERSVRVLSLTEAVQAVGILAVVVLLIMNYVRVYDSQSALLLLVFWALRLPLEARLLSASLQRVPPALTSAARLVEPLTALEHAPPSVREEAPAVAAEPAGVSLDVRDLRVVLGGQRILSNVSVAVRSGEHVAIVGTSGAGKSTLLAVLLGLIERAGGQVVVEGVELEAYDVGRLRRETVWVDPTVQLWNRSMLHNLQFGNPKGTRHPLESVLDRVDLKEVIERMPMGFATPLGEGGVRVSGGEGQRVRLARALIRGGARLILLDEAFRGLDRPTRRAISRNIRENARKATVLEVTHDVVDTRDFDRILVIEHGKLVEDGAPADLLSTPGSRYAELVKADLDVQRAVWDQQDWRRVTVERGTIVSKPPRASGG